MIIPKIFFIVIVSLLSTPAFSAETKAPSRGHLVFAVGAFQANQGEAQHLNIQGLIGNDMSVSKKHDEKGLLGLGYFFDIRKSETMDLSSGIHAFYLAKTSVTGLVTQENSFTNLSYKYNLTHIPIYAMIKAHFHLNSRYSLATDLGAGPNFMRANGYKEYSLDGVTLPDDTFTNNNKTTLSATAGLGLRVDHLLGTHAMEFGYRFFYLGQSEFHTRNSVVMDRLKTGHTVAHSLILSLDL